MELEKVKIHRIQQNGTAVSQITLDDDYNVPDYRPDIMYFVTSAESSSPALVRST